MPQESVLTPAPDVVLLLSADDSKIQFDAATPDPKADGGWHIEHFEPIDKLKASHEQAALQREYARLLRDRVKDEDLVGELVKWGRRLWDVLPHEFRDGFYQRVIAGKGLMSLQILSDAPTIWWELVAPPDEVRGNDLDQVFLGHRHSIARWHRGPRPLLLARDIAALLQGIPQSFNVLDAAIFVGPDIDAQVQFDTRIEQFFGIARANPGTPSQVKDLVSLQQARVVDILAHGTPTHLHLRSTGSTVSGDLSVAEVVGLGDAFEQPTMVVLHACNTGEMTDASALDDWIDALVGHLHCRVVLAPPTPIDHLAAIRLACRFYPLVGAGLSVGTALAMAKSSLPASAASAANYQCHGHCNAVVRFPRTFPQTMLADCEGFTMTPIT
jgi:hypothetical protein